MKRFSDRLLLVSRIILICLAAVIAAGLWELRDKGFFDEGGSLWPILGGMLLMGMIPMLGLLASYRHKGVLVLGNQAEHRSRW